MIVFDLKCSKNHQFEVWFRSSGDYEQQKQQGFLECPYCGDKAVEKALMAPNIGVKSNQRKDLSPSSHGQRRQDFSSGQQGQDEAQHSADDIVADDKVIKNQPKMEQPVISKEMQEMLTAAVKSVKDHVEKNFDNVGHEFAEEARRIHYGESKERPIYGEATAKETAELIDEGVDVIPLQGIGKKHS